MTWATQLPSVASVNALEGIAVGRCRSERTRAWFRIPTMFLFGIGLTPAYSRIMKMIDWKIKAVSFGSCNWDYGCPCQFERRPSQGNCRGFGVGRIERGHFGDVTLRGLIQLAGEAANS